MDRSRRARSSHSTKKGVPSLPACSPALRSSGRRTTPAFVSEIGQSWISRRCTADHGKSLRCCAMRLIRTGSVRGTRKAPRSGTISTQVYVSGSGLYEVRLRRPAARCRALLSRLHARRSSFQFPPTRIGCAFVGNFVGGIMTGQELLGPIVAADLGLSNVAAIRQDRRPLAPRAAARLLASAVDLRFASARGGSAALVIGVERMTGRCRAMRLRRP